MTVNLSPIGGAAGQFFDNNGDPLSGGKIFTYAAGTTTPSTTYTSSNGSIPHTNPINLDAAGRVPGGEIWLTIGDQYKFIIKTSTDVLIGSYDNLTGINSVYVPVVSVTDFGAVGDGVADDTTAFQLAFNSGAGSVYVPKGTYNYSRAMTITNTLRLYGDGTLNETTLLDTGITVTADNVIIEEISFSGPETYSDWTAGSTGYRQSFKQFVYFLNCSNGTYKGVKSSRKRGAVATSNCYNMLIESNRHESFFPDASTPVTDSNYSTCYRVIGGARNQLLNNSGSYCGSVVLIGSESSNNSVVNTTGYQCHDNGVYNSSGNYSSFVGGTFEDIDGSGVKVRGSGHTVTGFTMVRCGPAAAAAIALTGNGITPDAFGANGSGTICYGNTIKSAVGHCISVGSQDGYLPRDFIVANNTIEDHQGSEGFTAITVSGERGIKVVNNIIRGSTADYAIGAFGAVGNRAFDFDVSGNTISNCVVGIRAQNVDDSMFSGNTISNNSSLVMDFRLCDRNFITGNRSPSSFVIGLGTIAGRECFDNTATNNAVFAVTGNTSNIITPILKYQTGVWTPSYGTTGTDFSSVTYGSSRQGFYTRIGRLVTITGVIGTNAITVSPASGTVTIKGLPFTSSNSGVGAQAAVSVTRMSGFSGNNPSTSVIFRNANVISLQYRATSTGASLDLAISDLGTGANANNLVFSATYETDD